jgi:hypothetical protein
MSGFGFTKESAREGEACQSPSPFERFIRWATKSLPDGHMLLFAGGPEAVHGELEFAPLIGTTLRLA